MSIDPKVVENVAEDYAKFLKIDVSKDGALVEQIIDDTLTRLEEFQSVVEMVHNKQIPVEIDFIRARETELESIGDCIFALEAFVDRVHQDLNAVETLVDNAEADMGGDTGTIGKFLKSSSLFFKKKDDTGAAAASSSHSHLPPFEPPTIFKTSDYFPPGNNLPEKKED